LRSCRGSTWLDTQPAVTTIEAFPPEVLKTIQYLSAAGYRFDRCPSLVATKNDAQWPSKSLMQRQGIDLLNQRNDLIGLRP
jgi:hypothetical protein